MTKEEFILATIPQMAQYTFPYITSIIGLSDVDMGEHVGSGLRVVVNGRRAVITARHVVEQAAQFPLQFALSAGYGRPPYRVHGSIELYPVGDLAVYYLPDDFPVDAPEVAFWAKDRIQLSMDRLSTDFLFTHGFPGARSRFSQLATGIVNRSLPYGTMQRLEPPAIGIQPYEFALEFDPAGMRAFEPRGDTFQHPGGLSGSAVWRIGISGRTRAQWNPSLSLLVGFLTKWRPDEKVLIATSTSILSKVLVVESRG
jgi:hypothetical protein